MLSASALALTPAAYAAQVDAGQAHMTLSADAPAGLGLGGSPVAFTETIGNTGNTSHSVALALGADAGPGMPCNGLSLEYQGADGVWRTLSPTCSNGDFTAKVPDTFTVAPGKTRAVRLRIGLPMGEPHDGDSNGGSQGVELTSTLSAADSSKVLAQDVHDIAVAGLAPSFDGVPATAVAGGKPVEFKARVENPTPSEYVNVSQVLHTDRHTTVQIYRSGEWKTLRPLTLADEPESFGYILGDRDFSLAAHGSMSQRVRVSYEKEAPGGKAELVACAVVNGGDDPFRGTLTCTNTAVTVARSEGVSPSPSPSATAEGVPTPTGDSTTGDDGATPELAETGTSGKLMLAGAAGALMILGGVVLAAFRRRRLDA